MITLYISNFKRPSLNFLPQQIIKAEVEYRDAHNI